MRYADNLIKEAISLNWERLGEKWVREQKTIAHPAAFLQQFGTVRIDIGRMGGYTTFIKENAIHTDLIVVDKQVQVKEFNRGRIYTLSSIVDHYVLRFTQHKPEKVWVDCASMVFDTRQKKELFYNEMSNLGVNQIIMLG